MRIAVYVLILLLAGCQTRPSNTGGSIARFSHSSATFQQYMQDRYQCIREAQRPVSGAYFGPTNGVASSGVVVSQSMFSACMGARGYWPDPQGQFAPPPGAVVPMVP